MKRSRFFLILLALILIMNRAGAENVPLGQTVPDFTVETIDGGTFTLSEALKQYDAVLINLWATWCGYCVEEFPHLQEAYEQYKDRVAVIALSTDPEDTPAKMRTFAADMGLTFPMAQDPGGQLKVFSRSVGVPTNMMVDRFGRVAFYWGGALFSASSFTRLFDYFLDEDYTETVRLTSIPAFRPTSLTGAAGGEVAFFPAEDDTVWPMTVTAIDGREAVLSASNSGQPGSDAAACAQVDAAAGDALAFELRTDTFPALDHLFVSVDGEIVKRFSGQHDWTAWAIPLSEGSHTVGFGYRKGNQGGAGLDNVWIDNVRLVSGEEAAALLSSLPAAPAGEAFGVAVVNPEAREVVINDPSGVIRYFLYSDTVWVVNGSQADLRLTLTADNDPETAFLYLPDKGVTPGSILIPRAEDGFTLSVSVPDGSPLQVGAFSGVTETELDSPLSLTLYADESALTKTLRYYADNFRVDITWDYAETANEPLPAEAVYTVRVVDQNGDPVPGCIVNFCSDTACMPVMTGDDGAASFAGAPYAYHLQVIRVPAGYAFDTSKEYYANPRGGEIALTAEKQ